MARPPKPSDPDEPTGFLTEPDADDATPTRGAAGPSRSAASRRARLAGLEAERRREARRRGAILLVVCVVLGAAVLAYPVYLFVDDAVKRGRTIDDFGVSAAAAGCTPAQENAATGNQDHVADGTDVDYARLPPDSGPHYATPATFTRKFYATADRPPVEQLVHNLEHGYTVVWYRAEMPAEQTEDLRDIARTFTEQSNAGKFIAAPWRASDGAALPAGTNVVLTRWYADPADPADTAAQKGVRQSCGTVSGPAIQAFITKYPAADSPEPNGA